MLQASRSIAPSFTPVTSPQIDAHERQSTLPVGPTGVVHLGPGRPSRSARTAAAWSPTDRWAWAYALPVSGIARAVAGCIAYHANNKTGLGWPGIGKIVTLTGFKRTAVIAAIKEIERGGHFKVSRVKVDGKNKVNRYQLPPMGSAPRGPAEVVGSAPDGPGSPPDGLGGSASDGPESVRRESVQESVSSRARCQNCGHTWPDKPEYGTTCYRCQQPANSTREQPQEAAPPPDKAPATRPDPPPMTPERQAQLETEAIENGYHKRDDGQWTKGPQPTQTAAPPPPAETETRPPPEDTEPGPEERRFKAELAKWTKGKRRRTTA